MSKRWDLQTKHWKELKEQIIKRSNDKNHTNYTKGCCEKCGEHNSMLELHHKTYIRQGHELPVDVILLCNSCHNKEHNREDSSMKFDIEKNIATIKENGAYTKELNLVSWNGNMPVYDLRNWKNIDNEKAPLKGLTITNDEMLALKEAMKEVNVI